MSSRSPQDLDRLLAGGKPAGPELDSLWQRVQGRLAEQEPAAAHSAGWVQRWRWLLALGTPAMAASALAFFLWTGSNPTPNLQARGPGDGAPAIESSCGSSDHLCSVGEPVFLRLVAGEQAGTAVLVLEGGRSPSVLGAVVLQPGQDPVLPIQLLPEPGDAEGGLALRLWFAPGLVAPLTGGDDDTLARVRSADKASSVTRLLQVSAP